MTIIAEITALITLGFGFVVGKFFTDRKQSAHIRLLEARLQHVEALAVDVDAATDIAKRYRGETVDEIEKSRLLRRQQLRAQSIPMEWAHDVSSVCADYGSTNSFAAWSTRALCPPPHRVRHLQ